MYQNHLDALLGAWNHGSLDGLDAFLDTNASRNAPSSLNGNANDLNEFKNVVVEFRTAFPDLNVSITEAYFLDNRSICKWNFTATNTGPGDFPPTGKSVDITGVSIAKYRDGRLVSEDVFFDSLEFLTQLGLIELPQAASA